MLRGVERRDAQRLYFSAREGWLLEKLRSRQPVPPDWTAAGKFGCWVVPRAAGAARHSMIILIMTVTSLSLFVTPHPWGAHYI